MFLDEVDLQIAMHLNEPPNGICGFQRGPGLRSLGVLGAAPVLPGFEVIREAWG